MPNPTMAKKSQKSENVESLFVGLKWSHYTWKHCTFEVSVLIILKRLLQKFDEKIDVQADDIVHGKVIFMSFLHFQ